MTLLRRLLVAATFATCTLQADAATETSTLIVQVQINGTCAVNGNTLDFGQATVEQATFGFGRPQTTIKVACTNGTPFQVGIDDGSNAQAGQRRMKNESSEDYVNYELFKNRIGSDRFGDAVVAERVSGVGRGIHILTIPVYGELQGGQVGAPAGLYLDNAVITVYF